MKKKSDAYNDFIISEALDIIAYKEKIDRSQIEDRLKAIYGGSLEISIIDYFRNHQS